jgi:hypothetical protein
MNGLMESVGTFGGVFCDVGEEDDKKANVLVEKWLRYEDRGG